MSYTVTIIYDQNMLTDWEKSQQLNNSQSSTFDRIDCEAIAACFSLLQKIMEFEFTCMCQSFVNFHVVKLPISHFQLQWIAHVTFFTFLEYQWNKLFGWDLAPVLTCRWLSSRLICGLLLVACNEWSLGGFFPWIDCAVPHCVSWIADIYLCEWSRCWGQGWVFIQNLQPFCNIIDSGVSWYTTCM